MYEYNNRIAVINMKNNQLKINISIFVIIVIVAIFSSVFFYNYFNKEESKEIAQTTPTETSKNQDLGKENIVIFGDSITELYPVQDIYGDMPVLNSGVSGYRTQDLLDRMDSMLYKYNPSKVILLIGINDLMPNKSSENQTKIINNIKKIISEIKTNRPKAKIYLESIYPINVEMKDILAEPGDNEIIKGMNKRLEKYCKSDNVTYINMFDELINSTGELDPKYTNDGIHPNTMGYAKITRVLLPYIIE